MFFMELRHNLMKNELVHLTHHPCVSNVLGANSSGKKGGDLAIKKCVSWGNTSL